MTASAAGPSPSSSCIKTIMSEASANSSMKASAAVAARVILAEQDPTSCSIASTHVFDQRRWPDPSSQLFGGICQAYLHAVSGYFMPSSEKLDVLDLGDDRSKGLCRKSGRRCPTSERVPLGLPARWHRQWVMLRPFQELRRATVAATASDVAWLCDYRCYARFFGFQRVATSGSDVVCASGVEGVFAGRSTLT